MKHVAAALVRELGITEQQATVIVEGNARNLARYNLPQDLSVFGYIGSDGSSDVMLVSGESVICPLRIPATHWN